MNYINNIPLINDDNDDLLKSLIPSMDNFIESINTINNDTDSSYSCDPYTNNFHEGHVNINYLIKELKCNKELNVFFFDYTNYSIAKNIQPHQVYNPIFIDNYKEIEIDIAKSIPFSYMHYSGKRINTRLRVALNKRKCFLDLSDPGYVFNMKKDNPSFEIRFPYKDAVDKRDYSITPGIENDFRLLPKYNGIIIKATTVNDFLEVCKRIGNYHFALKRISEKYVEALLDNKTGSELNYLYENLPYSVIEYSKNSISISTEILLEHLYKLVEHDDTGWLSGWRDSSSAILNLLQIIGDSNLLYNLFKSNPKLIKRIYYNLDGKILYEGEYVRSRTVFAAILTILNSYNSCEDPEMERTTFIIGEHKRILSNQVTSDTVEGSYDLIQQFRTTKRVTKNIGGTSDGSASRQYETYNEAGPWQEDKVHYLEPLDLVYFLDESWKDKTPILVPVIYVKSVSDEKEWKDIHLSIRVGANILAIVLGVVSLGSASPLIVALGVVDIGLATTDILVAVSEDALMKTPEGQEFINTWNKIALGGGLATAGPLLIRGAFNVTGKLLAKATNPKTLLFLKDSVKNLLKKLKNIPDFKAFTIKVITDIWIEFKNITLIKHLENLRQLGVLIIKGEVKIKGVFKKEYVLIYKGEVIFSGSLKRLLGDVNSIIKRGGKEVSKYLDNIINNIDWLSIKIFKLGDDGVTIRNWIKLNKRVDDGWYNVLCHGNAKRVIINGKKYKPEELADFLLDKGYIKGTPIRLVSCNTGSKATGFAYKLSKILETKIIAPNNRIALGDAGEFIIDNKGKFIEFNF